MTWNASERVTLTRIVLLRRVSECFLLSSSVLTNREDSATAAWGGGGNLSVWEVLKSGAQGGLNESEGSSHAGDWLLQPRRNLVSAASIGR